MATRTSRSTINRNKTSVLERLRYDIQVDGAKVARFLAAKVVDFTTGAIKRHAVLVGKGELKHAIEDSATRGNQSRMEFTSDETYTLVSLTRRLRGLAGLVEAGDAFKTIYDWTMEDIHTVEPTILQMFVTPMLKLGRVRLPWTSEDEDDIDARKTFAGNAASALRFVEREGLDFIVQLILSGFWWGYAINDVAGERIVPFLTTPESSRWINRIYMPAKFYNVAPLQTGIPLLLAPNVLSSLYAANPDTDTLVVDRVFMRVLQIFFGIEMPFCSVDQERRNWVASSMENLVPVNDSEQAFTTLRKFVEFHLLNDPFLYVAIPDTSLRQLYVAGNMWNLKYGSELLSYFRSVQKYKSWFTTMKQVTGHMWHVILLKAMTENDTYVEDALHILGTKPGEVELVTALESFNPAQRKLAIKILTRHGINVPQNELGDTGVIGQLSAMGINPTPSVQRQWPPESRQWYAEHVVISQSSASDAVDRAFEPM